MKGLKGINILFGDITEEELRTVQARSKEFLRSLDRFQARQPNNSEEKAVTIASSNGLK